jgi:ABC-type lipoprotein release transport system permease subunit
MLTAVEDSVLTPILFTQGTIYPEGRIQNAMIRGIDPGQQIIDLPSDLLEHDGNEIPAIIGTRMAKNNNLKQGDFLTIRWRDVNGSFDATEVLISGIFKTNVPLVDVGQLYIPLNDLQNMMLMPDEASIIIIDQDADYQAEEGWVLRDRTYLLKEVKDMIKSKSAGGAIIYIMLLLLAMLAIFDTQVLSVFRRQKEIGTFIAMGMTRGQVIKMFTIEGAMYGVLAAILAALYGTPLLLKFREVGFAMPATTDDFGLAVAESIIPYYSAGLVVTTVLVVLLTTTVVSFLPVRKIARMKPTDAIKGKLQ